MSFSSYGFGHSNRSRQLPPLGSLPPFSIDNRQVRSLDASSGAFEGPGQTSRPTLPRPVPYGQTLAGAAPSNEYVPDQSFHGPPQVHATFSRRYPSNESWNAPLPPIQGPDLQPLPSWVVSGHDPFTATSHRPDLSPITSRSRALTTHMAHSRNALTTSSLDPTPNSNSAHFTSQFNVGTSTPGNDAQAQESLDAIASRDWSSPSIPAENSPRPFLADRTPTPNQVGSYLPPDGATTAPVQNPRLFAVASAPSFPALGGHPNTRDNTMPPEPRGRKRGITDTSDGQSKRRIPGKTVRPKGGKLKIEDDATPDMVDLNDDGKPALSNDKPADKKQKLSSFNCVICMDNARGLTTTHCGHMFCSECIHNSLHITHRKVCPICRQKIDARPTSGKFSARAKGFYALELKLMTAGDLKTKKP